MNERHFHIFLNLPFEYVSKVEDRKSRSLYSMCVAQYMIIENILCRQILYIGLSQTVIRITINFRHTFRLNVVTEKK